MEVKARAYTVDDVWEMLCQPGGNDIGYELIQGELIEMPPTNYAHGRLAFRIGRYLDEFAEPRNLGEASTEVGFYPAHDRTTLLAPDTAFVTAARKPDPSAFTLADFMPDLAVEVKSPSNSYPELRRKARIYLSNGTTLVWIIDPMKRAAEVWRVDEDGGIESETLDIHGVLRGEGVLPGFELPMLTLFPAGIS